MSSSSGEVTSTVMLSCEFCGSKNHAYTMFKRGGHVFCTPRHAIAWTPQRRGVHNNTAEEERLLEALADNAFVHIAAQLKLDTNGRKTPPLIPTRSLDSQEYGTLLNVFQRNVLWMDEGFAERLRASVEARLEEYTPANRSMAVVGPLSSDERMAYSTKILIRGPSDYFLVKVAGRPQLVLIFALDKMSPVIVVKI